jgi:hypothetical protein
MGCRHANSQQGDAGQACGDGRVKMPVREGESPCGGHARENVESRCLEVRRDGWIAGRDMCNK